MTSNKPLRFAVAGTGFWSNFQIAAWRELAGVELVALYNRTLSRAEVVAKKFGVKHVYDNLQQMLDKHELDFVDIITDVDTHAPFTSAIAQRGIDVVCQKPMAASLEQALEMVEDCRKSGSKLFIHENFRWQAPIRAARRALDDGSIGKPFKARLSFCSAFPVFENQPFLAELEHFIITDVGSHVLDIARFLFGEAASLYCRTTRVNPAIKGEDVANIFMEMKTGVHCYVELSYASILEKESFPQTLLLIEGDKGSIHLDHNFQLKISTRAGTKRSIVEPVYYSWADPAYAVVHSSIVDCNRDILNGLHGGTSETTGDDNVKTVELVWASYESASTGQVIKW